MDIVTKEKNYGIELLRILATLFVLLIHILGRGGVYPYAGIAENLEAHPASYTVSWILETAGYGAVDLFALVSGFVGINSRYRTKKWLKLWVGVVFLSVFIFFLFDKCTFIFSGFNELLHAIIPSVKEGVEQYAATAHDYLDSVFVIGTKQYWYFNMYTLLFMLMPLINAGIGKLEKKQLFVLSLSLFFAASIYKTIFDTDLFILGGGYSAIWLLIMYIFGATVRKFYDDGLRPNKLLCLLGYVLCVGIASGFRFLFNYLHDLHPENEVFSDKNGLLISYTSPFIVLGCVFLLFIFMRINLRTKAGRKIAQFFAGASFGIYIIQVHTAIWDNYLKNRFYKFAYEPTPLMVLHIFAVLVMLYLFFGAIEILRIYLFKLTRLDRLIERIGDGIDSAVRRLISREKRKKEV
ncbi:MAG: acyltransferase [Clostridia bacterium]|nr:acyltransferase [Clostridia bacterium]